MQVECDEKVISNSQRSTPSVGKGKSDDILTLSRLQNMLYVQYGEKHFDAWQQPLLYVSVSSLSIFNSDSTHNFGSANLPLKDIESFSRLVPFVKSLTSEYVIKYIR